MLYVLKKTRLQQESQTTLGNLKVSNLFHKKADMKEKEYQSVHYDSKITKALGLSNQKLRLEAAKDHEEKIYLDPEGVEIIEILDDTEPDKRRVLGHCTFRVYDEPFPFIYGSWAVRKRKPLRKVEPEKSVGEIIMEKFNSLIKEKGLPAFAGNELPQDKYVHSLYHKLGWVSVSEDDHWIGYNLPSDISQQQISQAIEHIRKVDPYYSQKES